MAGSEPIDEIEQLTRERAAHEPRLPALIDAARARRLLIRELTSAREAQGLSQAEIARRMSTSQPAIARLEGGEVDARLSTLDRYALALGMRIERELVPAISAAAPVAPHV